MPRHRDLDQDPHGPRSHCLDPRRRRGRRPPQLFSLPLPSRNQALAPHLQAQRLPESPIIVIRFLHCRRSLGPLEREVRRCPRTCPGLLRGGQGRPRRGPAPRGHGEGGLQEARRPGLGPGQRSTRGEAGERVREENLLHEGPVPGQGPGTQRRDRVRPGRRHSRRAVPRDKDRRQGRGEGEEAAVEVPGELHDRRGWHRRGGVLGRP